MTETTRTGQTSTHSTATGRIARVAALASATLLAGAALVASAPAAGAASAGDTYRPNSARQPIFFASDRHTGSTPQIYKLIPGKKGATRITTSATNDTQPSANRDRSLVAFTSQENVLHAHKKVEIMNTDGTGRRLLISGDADFSDPSLSPDGTKVVFTQRVGHNSQILMMDTNSNNLRLLTTTPGSKNRQAVFSPDGQKIAFTSERHGISDIFMMGLAGDQDATRVTYEGMGSAEPAWSPDGQKIAYSYYNQSTQDTEVLWVDAFSVNVVHNVSNHAGGDDRQPCWTPDGKNIVFSSSVGNNQEDLIAGNIGGTDSYLVTGSGNRNFDADCGYPLGRGGSRPGGPVDTSPGNSQS